MRQAIKALVDILLKVFIKVYNWNKLRKEEGRLDDPVTLTEKIDLEANMATFEKTMADYQAEFNPLTDKPEDDPEMQKHKFYSEKVEQHYKDVFDVIRNQIARDYPGGEQRSNKDDQSEDANKIKLEVNNTTPQQTLVAPAINAERQRANRQIHQQMKDVETAMKLWSAALNKNWNQETAIQEEEDVTVRFKKLEIQQNTLRSVLDNQELQTMEQEFDKVIDLYINMKDKWLSIFSITKEAKNVLNQSALNQSNQNQSAQLNVKLPPLTIPSFDGKIQNFHNFADTFKTVVIDNEKLSEAQKLLYLKGALVGDAKNEVSNINCQTNNCFELAWNNIQKKYGNKRMIVMEAIDNMFNLPKLYKENCASLKKLKEDYMKAVQQVLGTNERLSGNILMLHILLGKLDSATKKDFEIQLKNPTQVPDVQLLLDFLDKKIIALSNAGPAPQGQTSKSHSLTTNATNCEKPSKQINACKSCGNFHYLNKCPKFLSLTPQVRCRFVSQHNLCSVCLNAKDKFKPHNCRLKITCYKCKGKHNSLLHVDGQEASKNVTNAAMKHRNGENTKRTVLATAAVKVKNPITGQEREVRALIDQGSEVTILTNEVMEELKLPYVKVNRVISGVGGLHAGKINKECQLTLKPRFNSPIEIDVKAIVMKQLTNYSEEMPQEIEQMLTADYKDNKCKRIEMLIGANYMPEIMKEGMMRIGSLLGQDTKLGWIFSGPSERGSRSYTITANTSVEELEQKMKLWFEMDQEVVEDELAENHFVKTTTKEADGRYVVRLPFKEDNPQIETNKAVARARLLGSEKRMKNNAPLKKHYNDFMKEYIELGHMERISHSEAEGGVYLPHHVVTKESESTPYRVVFNASQKGKFSGLSLNDHLMTGPKVQQDLNQILMRWRLYPYVITADVEKMYRQIKLHSEDCKFQQIYWRENEEEAMQTYRLKTITYGMGPAGFLAARTLKQIAIDQAASDQKIKTIIEEDFYMDDLMTGAYTIEEAQEIVKSMTAILSKAKFNLRKWATNRQETLKPLQNNENVTSKLLMQKDSSLLKALGMSWCTKEDLFMFIIKDETFLLEAGQGHLTKRMVLSKTAQIFDPLGLISPLLLTMRAFIQKLWVLKLGWDSPIPEELAQKWIEYHKTLNLLNGLRIPRCVGYDPQKEVELHAFCDASEKAYAAVIYIKLKSNQGSEINLLTSKAKVAPITSPSIARLELCAAVLSAKLVETVQQATKINFSKIVYWSDSIITLSWIHNKAMKWDVYVANRVKKIHATTNEEQWHYIETKKNPADCASRGYEPEKFVKHFDTWIHGPEWLKEVNEYPIFKPAEAKEISINVAEHKKATFYLEWIHKYSNYKKAIRIMTYMRKFIDLCKKKDAAKIPLKEQWVATENELMKELQDYYFSKEISQLKEGKELNKRYGIKNLQPFLDKENVMRVGGRLENANLSYDQKHPIIIPYAGHVTQLIVREAHLKTLHGGPTLTLAEIRQKYWIVKGKNASKKAVSECVTCARIRAETGQQLMGALPAVRLQSERAFKHCGVDFAGPLQFKSSHLRGCRTYKGYFAVFVCMVTKAVHLEAVSDLTAEAFEAALKRFISRRGPVESIYSDNASNFVRANKNLEKDLRTAIVKCANHLACKLEKEGVQWHFIPPSSPHFGGLWEAGVKSVKYHLKRIVGGTTLTFEEMATVLTQIEAVLNSRPLCPLSNDINDLEYLTPGHFLIGTAPILPPEADLTESSPKSRWKVLQKLVQNFWKKWHMDYLSKLQNRPKWNKTKNNFKKGQLVLIKEENQPPLNWAMGKIMNVKQGQDGLVRVAELKTMSGALTRPIHKLCLLPIIEPQELINPAQETPPQGERQEINRIEDTRPDEPRITRARAKKLKQVSFNPVPVLCYLALALKSIVQAEIHNEKSIWVQEGRIGIRGYDECLIERQNIRFAWERQMGPKIPGIWFGSIKYNCSGVIGYLESKLACFEDSIYNSLNDEIVGCEHHILKYCFGSILGFLMFLAFYILDNKFHLSKRLKHAMIKCTYFRAINKTDQKATRLHEMHARMFNTKPEGDYKPFHENVLGTKRSQKLKTKRAKRKTALEALHMVALLFCFTFVQVNAGDRILYVSSEGKVCEDSNCEVIHSTFLSMATGSTIHFIDEKNDRLTLQLLSLSQTDLYKQIYFTSDYVILHTSFTECYGDWNMGNKGNCWDGSCRKDTRYYQTSLDNYLKNTAAEVVDYGCMIDPMGCQEKWCYRNARCVFYKWVLRNSGNLIPVYQKTTTGWQAQFRASYKNSTTTVYLTSENPMEHIYAEDWKHSLPVVAHAPVKHTLHTLEHMIKFNSMYYYTHANPLNGVAKGYIGEYQISMDQKTRVYDIANVMCEARKCKSNCFTTTSALQRFEKSLAEQTKPETIFPMTDKTVCTLNSVAGSVSLMVATDKLKGLDVTPPMCIFEQINSYACTGCSELGYVTIAAKYVENPGILSFNSNCTFQLSYVACQSAPFILPFSGELGICSLYFPAINFTMIVTINSVFKGDLVPIKLERGRYQEITSIVKSPEFIKGIVGSLTTFSCVSFLTAFLFKAFQSWLTVYQLNKAEKVVQSTESVPTVIYKKPNTVRLELQDLKLKQSPLQIDKPSSSQTSSYNGSFKLEEKDYKEQTTTV